MTPPTRSSPSAAPAAGATTPACTRWRARPRRGARHRALAGRDARPSALSGTRPVLLLPGRLDAALAVWLVLGRRMLARLSGGTARATPSGQSSRSPARSPPPRARRSGPGALRDGTARAHSLGLSAAVGAGAGRRLDSGAGRQRGISAGRRGRGKTLAMSDALATEHPAEHPICLPRSAAPRGRSNSSKWCRPRKRARALRATSICRRSPAETRCARRGARPRARARRGRADRRAAVRPRQCRRLRACAPPIPRARATPRRAGLRSTPR